MGLADVTQVVDLMVPERFVPPVRLKVPVCGKQQSGKAVGVTLQLSGLKVITILVEVSWHVDLSVNELVEDVVILNGSLEPALPLPIAVGVL